MSEWKEYKLGEFIKVKHGFAFKGEYITTEETHNILVTPGNFHIGGGFKDDKFKYYNNDEFPSEYILKGGDIVVTMTDLSKDSDTLGYSAKIPYSKNHNYLHNQRIGLILFINNAVCPDFIYWIMRTREYQSYIVGSASGTSIMHTSPSRIEDYSCLLPSLKTQCRIASILTSLDDKIDLLRRENATLEAMAETLFRQWFVEEEKDDWWERMLGDFFDVKTGKRDANYSVENGSFPFFTCSKQTLSAPSYSFEGSAILLAGNGDFNVKRYVGKFEAYQRTYVLIPYEVKYFNLLYIVIKYYLDEITGGHRGSVISFITKGMITDFTVRFPMEDIDNKLKQFDVIFERVDSNINQIQTLIQTRDGLLPKLMNNEIKVE